MQMCRICLVQDMETMHSIVGTALEDIYQSLTEMLYVTADTRPLQVCYICRGRLLSSYRLKMNCLYSERFFTQMTSSNVLPPDHIKHVPVMRLTKYSAITLSNVPQSQENLKYDVKQEPLEFSHEIEVKQENLQDINDCCMEDVEADHSVPSIETEEINSLELNLGDINTNSTTNEYIKYNLNKKEEKLEEYFEEKNLHSQPFKETNKISIISKRNRNYKKKKQYICKLCDKSYSTKGSLSRHQNIHSGEVTYRCNTCEKCFTSKNKLELHSCIQTDKQSQQCDTSDKGFSNKTGFITDISKYNSIKPIKCEICNYTCSSISNLKPHIRTHTGERPFKCDTCNKCFSIKRNLKRHIQIHNGVKPYKCNTCDKSFTVKYSLEVHIRRHTGERPFKCEMCKECFVTKSELQSHLLLHSIGKSHKCNLCNKCFKSRSQLIRHIRVHTGEKTHQCEVCKKYFTRKAHLKIHSRMHTGEKKVSKYNKVKNKSDLSA